MFDGFENLRVVVGGNEIAGRIGGSGPPLLLLHGIPQTHLMWHRVAPALAERFTVVATDLRGFGGSGKPASTPDHAPYAMRVIAAEQVAVMRELGFERFAVAGHDRGGRCAYRMALDHPDVITRLSVLDVVPTGEVFDRADKKFALAYWVWSFLAAPHPVPEQLIAAAPDPFVDYMLDHWSGDPGAFDPVARAAYVDQFRDPATVHAICEEYRAAATIDHQHDSADRGRRLIQCPVQVLWDGSGALGSWYGDPLAVWRHWAGSVTGQAIGAGHFLPEQAPSETAAALLDFLT
jgi:haloacetate dehalogenase